MDSLRLKHIWGYNIKKYGKYILDEILEARKTPFENMFSNNEYFSSEWYLKTREPEELKT